MSLMNVETIVNNELTKDEFLVWTLKNHTKFSYSDGSRSEKYLDYVFRSASDLSSKSVELETYIRDWPSEYHLTKKRSQLLSGFNFDRSLNVLEVGCGCGAITQFLGENFNHVVAVEGSLNRARLTRLRTRSLDNVSVICAPFQSINFSLKFDIVFCIGVYEYSESFIDDPNPYIASLKCFSDMLTPDGMLVIAIENQFGLKYFDCAREDHLGIMFDGIEGYHRRLGKVRTFGKYELQENLKKYFPSLEFFYPYPDYKLPDCVMSHDFIVSGLAGELVSQIKPRDYHLGPLQSRWNYSAVSLELDRNRMLDFFSNSFVVLASKGNIRRASFNQLAIIFSANRKVDFCTETRVIEGADQKLIVSKSAINGKGIIELGNLKLVDTEVPWVDGLSLQTQIQLRANTITASLGEIFAPCKLWVNQLISESTIDQGVLYVDGKYIDTIWSNVYLNNDRIIIIDKEWIWNEKIRMNSVVIRAIYHFLVRTNSISAPIQALSTRSGKALIKDIANTIGVRLCTDDFNDFVRLETELQCSVFGIRRSHQSLSLRWFLFDQPTLDLFYKNKILVKIFLSRTLKGISRLFN